MNRRLVWVTGAGGLIGSHLVRTSARFAPSWTVRGWTRPELDLTDAAAVRRAFDDGKPDLVIHCAALAHTPTCDRNPALARQLNVEVVDILTHIIEKVPMIFFSTDLVFDGRAGNYNESAPVNPISVYGETKLAAEKIVLSNPRHVVVRTALNGGTSPTGDRGFNEQLRRAFQEGRTLQLFTDEFRSPIPSLVTAQAVWELAAQNATGIFHLAGAERLSRFQIGQLVAARWPQLHPKIEVASAMDFPGPPRPADVSLNCAKLQKLLSFRLPGLGEWLAANPQEVF
jgi:dTDP-4-dehydrorhamnose reductase